MSEWQAGYVESNGLRLHYTRTGGSKPPLVLAHGVTDDGLCWSPLAAALATDYDVIMVDARGHGRSDAPEDGYGGAVQAADLAGLIAALGLHRPAVLGHSMGAITALALAGLYPDVPGAVLLEDPPPWWVPTPPTPESTAWLGELHQRASALKRMTRDELLAHERQQHPNWTDDELQPWADSKHRFSPHVLGVFSPANVVAVDWPALLPHITCPVLLISADPDHGGLVTPEHAAKLRAAVPQLESAHIPAAGNSIRRDQLDRYVQVVREFLAAQAIGR